MSEAQPSPGPYTWDDFVRLEEDDLRELIDGELVEVEVPTKMHAYIVWMLAHYLAAWALPRKAGFGVVSGFKVRISERRGVMPDLQFFRSNKPRGQGGCRCPRIGPPGPRGGNHLRVEPTLRQDDEARVVRGDLNLHGGVEAKRDAGSRRTSRGHRVPRRRPRIDRRR